MGATTIGILLMALGGPLSLDDVEPFLKDIRRGRDTPRELVDEFRERYRQIGGRSPLLDISRAQGKALEARLRADGEDVRAYVGMRHWRPFIRESLREIAADGLRRAVGLCLTPYYSRMSVGAYVQAARDGVASENLDLHMAFVESWNDEPALADAYAGTVREGLARLAAAGGDDPVVLFTAHSLPRRIVDEGDPYERELHETMAAVLARLPPVRARLAYQSAGRTPEPWLGPSLESVLEEIGKGGERAVLVAPFGFVSDHIEILYDVDIEARRRANAFGMRFDRAESLNTDPTFIEAMASAVRKKLRAA
jgi:ferrochelatase